MRWEIASARETILEEVPKQEFRNEHVSPDGRWLAIAEMDQAASAIMALELVSNRLREMAH